jgi:uncharacterized membrane protein
MQHRGGPNTQIGNAMRTVPDRIRHAVSFEIIALFVIIPLAAWGYGMPLDEIGAVAVVSATIATVWNYAYNVIFDRAMLARIGHLRKTPMLRVLHAVLFELGLLTVLAPYIAWHLSVGLMQAMMMDLSFSLFYVVYAFAFNWAYDAVFPVPLTAPSTAPIRRG